MHGTFIVEDGNDPRPMLNELQRLHAEYATAGGLLDDAYSPPLISLPQQLGLHRRRQPPRPPRLPQPLVPAYHPMRSSSRSTRSRVMNLPSPVRILQTTQPSLKLAMPNVQTAGEEDIPSPIAGAEGEEKRARDPGAKLVEKGLSLMPTRARTLLLWCQTLMAKSSLSEWRISLLQTSTILNDPTSQTFDPFLPKLSKRLMVGYFTRPARAMFCCRLTFPIPSSPSVALVLYPRTQRVILCRRGWYCCRRHAQHRGHAPVST